MEKVQIRPAKAADCRAVAAIYHDYVVNTVASLELDPPTCDEMACRICACGEFYPFLVCEVEGKVAAYTHAGRHLEQPAFDWNATVSTYVEQTMSGKGIGRALLDALEGVLRVMGVINLYSAVTFHARSQYFHIANGFTEAGRFREVVYKQGMWRDLAYYEKSLALHDKTPAPVRSVKEIEAAQLQEICDRAAKRIRI